MTLLSKDKNSDKKIDMYEYWNVTFNVWNWGNFNLLKFHQLSEKTDYH